MASFVSWAEYSYFAGRFQERSALLQYQGAPLLVYDDRLHGKKEGLETEEAHLNLDVLRQTLYFA
jgi:hypothetical protein